MAYTTLSVQSEVELLMENNMEPLIKNTATPITRNGIDGVFVLEDVLAEYGFIQEKTPATTNSVQLLHSILGAKSIFARKDGANNIKGSVGMVVFVDADGLQQRRFTFDNQEWFEWDKSAQAIAHGWGIEELLNHLYDEDKSYKFLRQYLDFIDNTVYPNKYDGTFVGEYIKTDEALPLKKSEVGQILEQSLDTMPSVEGIPDYEAVSILGVGGVLQAIEATQYPFPATKLSNGTWRLGNVEFEEEKLLAYHRNVEQMFSKIYPAVMGQPFSSVDKMVLFAKLGNYYREQQSKQALNTLEDILEESNEQNTQSRLIEMPDSNDSTNLSWTNWDKATFLQKNLNDCVFSALQGVYQSAVMTKEFLYYLARDMQPISPGERIFQYDWSDKKNPKVNAKFLLNGNVEQVVFPLSDSARVSFQKEDFSLTGFAIQVLSQSNIPEYKKYPARQLKKILEQAAKSTILYNFPKDVLLSSISGLIKVNHDRFRSKKHEIIIRDTGYWQDFRNENAVDEEGHPYNKYSTIDLFRHVTGLNRKDAVKKLFNIIEGASDIELNLSSLQQNYSENSKSKEEEFALNYPTLLDKEKNRNQLGVFREYFTQERGLPNFMFDELYGKYMSAGFYDRTQSAIYGKEIPPIEEQSMVLVFTPNDSGVRFAAVRSIHKDYAGKLISKADAVKQNLPGANAGIGSFCLPADMERYQTQVSSSEKRIAFVEAPLDAISYHALFPCETVFSQNGLNTSGLINTLQSMYDFAEEGRSGLKLFFACDNTNPIGKDNNGINILNERGEIWFDSGSHDRLDALYKVMHKFCAETFINKNREQWQGDVESFVDIVSNLNFSAEQVNQARQIFIQFDGDESQKLGAAVFHLHYVCNGLFEVKSPEHPKYGRYKDWNDLILNAYRIEKANHPEYSNVEIHEMIKKEVNTHDGNAIQRTEAGTEWFEEIKNREVNHIVQLKGLNLDFGFME